MHFCDNRSPINQINIFVGVHWSTFSLFFLPINYVEDADRKNFSFDNGFVPKSTFHGLDEGNRQLGIINIARG
jgi:hypothetical protein